jgi:LmbE family N-acetylglucosaminyl deacetylase
MSGHPDHRLVSAVVTQVFQEDEPGWPRNLYYPGFPRDRAAALPAIPGVPPLPLTADRYLSVRVPYEERDALRARESFACHRSQFTPQEQEGLFAVVGHFQAGPWPCGPGRGSNRRATSSRPVEPHVAIPAMIVAGAPMGGAS